MTEDTIDEVMRRAADRMRAQDFSGARATLETAIAADPNAQPLRAFAGLLACQAGEPNIGVVHLRRALATAPDDRATRTNLVLALLELGRLDEAEETAMLGDAADPRLARALGYIHQQHDRPAEAAEAYERVVAAFPQDFECWNNLANARASAKNIDAAMQAFRRAVELRRDSAVLRLNAAQALEAAGRHETRLRWLRDAVSEIQTSAELYYQLGNAESIWRNIDRAESAFRAAIARDARHAKAYLGLGQLYEALNQLDDLAALIGFAARQGVTSGEIDFLRAWELRRKGAFAEALSLAESVDETIEPIRRSQLLGDLYDRLGDPDRAFAAYQAMNAATARTTSELVYEDAALYLDEVRANAALLTAPTVARWSPAVTIAEPPPPIFIAGFPRSGTTLLDTLLMGLPDLHVLEEQPVMRAAEAAMGDLDRLPDLDAPTIASLRARYFDELDAISPPAPGKTVVDKSPLHMTRIALIHRLFPDAKIIFSQRHPCDCVLSCFASSFQPNRAMTHCQTLDGAAALYDAAFEAWTRACDTLPVAVHVVRYERLVDDPQAEMRALLDFLGLPWDQRVLDNQRSAANRGRISTASYAQVTEPIYHRSVGRWRRYRAHLAPVLPILAPWAERMGYEM